MPRYLVTSDGPISVRALARPGHGLPWPGGPTDPGWGVDEGEPPQVEPPEEPPPGIWPGPTPGHPIEPIPRASPGTPTPGSRRARFGLARRTRTANSSCSPMCRATAGGISAVDMDALPEPPAGGVGGRPPQRPGGSPEVDPTRR